MNGRASSTGAYFPGVHVDAFGPERSPEPFDKTLSPMPSIEVLESTRFRRSVQAKDVNRRMRPACGRRVVAGANFGSAALMRKAVPVGVCDATQAQRKLGVSNDRAFRNANFGP